MVNMATFLYHKSRLNLRHGPLGLSYVKIKASNITRWRTRSCRRTLPMWELCSHEDFVGYLTLSVYVGLCQDSERNPLKNAAMPKGFWMLIRSIWDLLYQQLIWITNTVNMGDLLCLRWDFDIASWGFCQVINMNLSLVFGLIRGARLNWILVLVLT